MGVVHVGVAGGTGSSRATPPPPTAQAAGVVVGGGRCLSHLVSGAEGGLAELADLPDVFPGHHPSPPETPTYHALDVGVQAQRRRALRFAAGQEDMEGGGGGGGEKKLRKSEIVSIRYSVSRR